MFPLGIFLKSEIAKVLKHRKFPTAMKRGISNLFVHGESFKKEFKKQVRMIIVFTLGFTIAFTWRQTIFDLSLNLVTFLTKIKNSSELSILTSILITLFSLILIILTSHLLKEGSTHF